MEIKKKVKLILILITISLLFAFVKTQSQAAGGSISVDPASGNLSAGQTLNADITIDGAGTAFNAAKASIVVSSNLSIQNVTFGDCGFAYVVTPSNTDPSFAGVILGSSSTTCHAFKLTLKAVNSGAGSITLSNASIKSYRGAGEMLSSLKSGSYNITGTIPGGSSVVSVPSPTSEPTSGTNGVRLYTVTYSLFLQKGIIPSQVVVSLDPKLATKITVRASTTPGSNNEITATFPNVTEGIHAITAYYNGGTIASEIINVTGKNKDVAFSSNAERTTPVWVWFAVAVTVITFLVFTILIIYILRRKK